MVLYAQNPNSIPLHQATFRENVVKSNAQAGAFYESLFHDGLDIENHFTPPGYEIFYSNREKEEGSRVAGGVCIFWRQSDIIKPTRLNFNNSKDNYDICAVMLDNKFTGSKTILIAVYMMHLTAGREAQYTDFRNELKAKKLFWKNMWPNVKFIITGDFNLGKEFIGKGLDVIPQNYKIKWVQQFLIDMQTDFDVVQRNTIVNDEGKVLELLFIPKDFDCVVEAAPFQIIPKKDHHEPVICRIRNFFGL